jgi:fatty acid desaturase
MSTRTVVSIIAVIVPIIAVVIPIIAVVIPIIVVVIPIIAVIISRHFALQDQKYSGYKNSTEHMHNRDT